MEGSICQHRQHDSDFPQLTAAVSRVAAVRGDETL